MEPRAALVQAVRAHRGEVACLDERGGRLASGGGTVLRLWRWAAGAGWALAAEAKAAHRYGVPAVRWAPAGALLASGGVDGAVRLWGRSLAAGRQLAAPGAAAVRALCWAAGGARLLAGHDDGVLCVWAASGSLLARLPAHDAALHALAATARDSLLLTAAGDGVLKVYDFAAVCGAGVCDAADGAPAPLLWEDGAHDLGALCADASESGAVATGGHDARVRLWAAGPDGLAAAGALDGHSAAVTALRWARDGSALASASLDRSARLWAPETRACLLVVPAHERYLTCVALAPDSRYMITGSNDKTFRMWSLGALSLDDELEPPCAALEHFALGDLEVRVALGANRWFGRSQPASLEQGIGPVEEAEEGDAAAATPEGARCVWSERAHAGPINCIAAADDVLATASSDGAVKVWRRDGDGAELLHELRAHRYPVLAADFGAGGAVLLSGGLDGCAFLWDVRTGVALRSLAVPGGGVRGARVSPSRPLLLLLATDEGLAPLWRLADADPHPLHVYAAHAEAATCCAWSADGRAAATGAASGELRVLAPPPRAACLHHRADAHDLGVLSCDFAPPSASIDLPADSHLLATAGSDSLVKLWRVDLREEPDGEPSAGVELLRQVAAHGGAVAGVRWGAGVMASAGEDRWARVWRVTLGAGGLLARAAGAAPAQGAGGALAVAPLAGGVLAVGSLAGELALWRIEPTAADEDGDDEGDAPALWSASGVLRWLRDHVADAPSAPAAAALEERVRAVGLTGARLLSDPLEDLMEALGFATGEAGAQRVLSELRWLRAPPPPPSVEALAPHALRCPLSHRLLRSPSRASDGYSYERAALLEWLRAAPPEGAASPVSGRRLRCARVAPNRALRDQLREFLRTAGLAPPDEPPDELLGEPSDEKPAAD